MPNLVTYLNSTHVFEWYMIRWDFENGCQNKTTILDFVVNFIMRI